MPVRDTKGSHLSRRYLPPERPVATRLASVEEKATSGAVTLASGQTLYALLGVTDEVGPEDLKAAFRQRALAEHPDKGGDQDRFDEVHRAFTLLEDPVRRETYDDELREAKARVKLVIGGPTNDRSEKVEEVGRKKTAPTAGSTRSKDWHQCSKEWAGEKSGAFTLENIRLALTDAQGPMSSTQDPVALMKDQTEALFEKYKSLPPGSDNKKRWVNSLTGKQKAALKNLAKEYEAEQMKKAQKWLKK
mmetsp:Transcript_35071/g.56328  ORF Transcript_35071/g.56328 Transcript_35071/m.56328 type:complete len:247 (+) Transcript_35071:95-835(+)